MGWLDTLLGRPKPAQPDLDELFALPSAAVTLQAATGLHADRASARCASAPRRAARSPDSSRTIRALLGERPRRSSRDAYGYTWLVVRRAADDCRRWSPTCTR